MVSEATEEPIESVEIQTFPHRGNPSVKAYFKFETTELTFSEFEKLRKHILGKEGMQVRIFFFADEANSFRTLFLKGVRNPNDLE